MYRARGRVALGLLMAACNHGSKASAPGCCGRAQSTRLDAGGWEGRSPWEGGVPAPVVTATLFRKEEGCSRDFKTRGEPSQDLAELARLCGQGMASYFTEVLASPNRVVEVPFRITSPGCFRAAAVGVEPGLSMTLLDPLGNVLATASSRDPFILVPIDGTVCVRDVGDYRTSVRLASPDPHSASSVTVQIWQASHE